MEVFESFKNREEPRNWIKLQALVKVRSSGRAHDEITTLRNHSADKLPYSDTAPK